MDVFAVAGGQPLCPQDEVALVTQGVHDQLILRIIRVLPAVHQHYDVPLEQRVPESS